MDFLVIFTLALVLNFLTLYIVIWKYKKPVSFLFTNPAFLFGDFLLIPLYFVLVWYFITKNLELVLHTNYLVFTGLGVFALVITLGFGFKFKLLKIIWIPHGIIHWLAVFSFLTSVLLSFYNASSNLLVIICAAILLVHRALGIIFPKRISAN